MEMRIDVNYAPQCNYTRIYKYNGTLLQRIV